MKKLVLLLMLLISTTFIFAVDFKVDDYTESELCKIRDMINTKLVYDKRGEIIIEDDNISVSYIGWTRSYGATILQVTIINKSDEDIILTGNLLCVNDCSIRGVYAIPVGAKKRLNAAIINIHDSTLEDQWIDSIEYVEFSMRYTDSNLKEIFAIEDPIHLEY